MSDFYCTKCGDRSSFQRNSLVTRYYVRCIHCNTANIVDTSQDTENPKKDPTTMKNPHLTPSINLTISPAMAAHLKVWIGASFGEQTRKFYIERPHPISVEMYDDRDKALSLKGSKENYNLHGQLQDGLDLLNITPKTRFATPAAPTEVAGLLVEYKEDRVLIGASPIPLETLKLMLSTCEGKSNAT